MAELETIQTVISGSFRKHLREIVVLKGLLAEEGIGCLSPESNHSVNPEEEFVILESDPVSSPELLQSSIFAKIRKSTILTVANIDGYLGKAAVLEIGYAIAVGIKVYTLEPVSDPNIAPYCKELDSLFPGIKAKLQSKVSPGKIAVCQNN